MEVDEIEIGSIWATVNSLWQRNISSKQFQPKDTNGLHPGLIVKDNGDGYTFQIAPGTTKEYDKGVCVFCTSLRSDVKTNFLMHLAAPVTSDDMEDHKRGWNGVYRIVSEQVQSLLQQYHFCCNSF